MAASTSATSASLHVEDLLGRSSVEPDCELMTRDYPRPDGDGDGRGRLNRQRALPPARGARPGGAAAPRISELALYEMHRELESRADEQIRIVPLLGSVCDEARDAGDHRDMAPDIIYHAAAYKHVPLVEHNPAEGIRTNVFGTFTLARVAARTWSPAASSWSAPTRRFARPA